MPRSEIERADAVAAAREVFWRNGYDDTSVADIVNATGFNRYALYNAFGGKLEVFLAVLDAYYAERKSIFLQNLNNPDVAPLDAIRAIFAFAISEMAERKTGCLMCNVASEVGCHDNVILERIDSYLDEIRRAYGMALERAAERGELNPSISPDAGARVLIALKLGIGTQARHGATREEMMHIVDTGLNAIGRATLQ